jgi:hypothetical protein
MICQSGFAKAILKQKASIRAGFFYRLNPLHHKNAVLHPDCASFDLF